jgi:hypothetical protein
MPKPCTLCFHPDQAAVQGAFGDGLSDRRIAKMFHLSHVQVGYHRRRHLLKLTTAPRVPSDNGAAKRQQQKAQLADAQDAIATTRARFSLEAQLDKVESTEAMLDNMGHAAIKSGSFGVAIQIADKKLKAVEVGSKLAQVGGYKQLHIPPQSDERGRWSITYVFQGAGKVEEIRLAEAPGRRAAEQAMAQPGTRSRLEIDVPEAPPAIDGTITTSLSSYTTITPEVDEELIERLAYRPAPDEQAEG